MMRGKTAVHFCWDGGRHYGQVAKHLFEHFQAGGFRFKRDATLAGAGVFGYLVTAARGDAKGSCRSTDTPWLEDPWLDPATELVFLIVQKPSGQHWASIYADRRTPLHSPTPHETDGSKLHALRMCFDGRLWAQLGESPEQFQDLLLKYEQIKKLYGLLGCDEVAAWDEYYLPNPDFLKRFPFHRDKMLRIAREGPQVLVRRMEEAQQFADYHWIEARIFIDPPGVPGLPSEEYRRRWSEFLPGSLPLAP